MIIVIILAVFFVFLENNNNSSDDLFIKQIRTNSVNALDNITTYKCNASGKLSFTYYVGNDISFSNSWSNTTLSVNISSHMLEHIKDQKVDDEEEFRTLTYMENNYKYNGYETDGNITWETEDLSPETAEAVWIMISALEQFVSQMSDEIFGQELNIKWKRLNDESINNHMCYVLKSEFILNRTDKSRSGYDQGEIYHTFWIDQDSSLLLKLKLDQIRDSTGSYTSGEDRIYLVGEDIFNFYDFNIPINIQLPPEITR